MYIQASLYVLYIQASCQTHGCTRGRQKNFNQKSLSQAAIASRIKVINFFFWSSHRLQPTIMKSLLLVKKICAPFLREVKFIRLVLVKTKKNNKKKASKLKLKTEKEVYIKS